MSEYSQWDAVPMSYPDVAVSVQKECSVELHAVSLQAEFERGVLQGERQAIERIGTDAARAATEKLRRIAEEFERERDAMMLRLEQEAAGIALAVARKVLMREAERDPLMLLTAVKIAVEQLDESLCLEIRVPQSQEMQWRQALSGSRIEVKLDSSLETGDCILQSEIGKVDLGWKAQVHEIEAAVFASIDAKTAHKVQ